MTPTEQPEASWAPQRHGGHRLQLAEGVAYVVDGAGRRVVTLNETAQALWELCDGSTTVEEMVGAVAVFFIGCSDNLLDQVWATLMQMRTVGLVA